MLTPRLRRFLLLVLGFAAWMASTEGAQAFNASTRRNWLDLCRRKRNDE